MNCSLLISKLFIKAREEKPWYKIERIFLNLIHLTLESIIVQAGGDKVVHYFFKKEKVIDRSIPVTPR